MRILFVTATRIGDAVLSTGLLDHLVRQHPGARVTVACGPVAAPLFEDLPGLERVITLRKLPYSLHWLQFWASCAGTVWDRVVDLRRAPLSYLLMARRQHHLERNRDDVHRVVKMAGLLGLEDNPPAPHVWVSEDRAKRAGALIPDGGPVLAVGPAANWRAKTWRAEYFAELIGRLTGSGGILPGARVALFGHGDERSGVLPAIEAVPEDRRIDLVGKLHLLDVCAALRRCAFYVGNDSGLMHMAAASGIPTLGLFGPSREEHYAPWGPLGRAVRGSKEFDEIFPEDFDHRTSDTLMDCLGVDTVEAAARDLWRAAGEGKA